MGSPTGSAGLERRWASPADQLAPVRCRTTSSTANFSVASSSRWCGRRTACSRQGWRLFSGRGFGEAFVVLFGDPLVFAFDGDRIAIRGVGRRKVDFPAVLSFAANIAD